MAEDDIRLVAQPWVAALAALLAGLAIAFALTAALNSLYPAPEYPTTPSIGPPTTAFEEEIFRFAEKERSVYEHAQARRALVLPIAELATAAALVVVGLAVPRRNRLLGDALIMGGLFMLMWAEAWIYKVHAHTSPGLLADRGMTPALVAAVFGCAVVVYAGWWKYVHDRSSSGARGEYGRLVHLFYDVFLATSLVYTLNIIWIWVYFDVNARYQGPYADSVAGFWFANVLMPTPEYAPPSVRFAYGAALSSIGLALRGTRLRGLAGGVLLAGYLGLTMSVLGAGMLFVDAPEYLWCVPAGIVGLVVTAYLQSKPPRARSGGTS